MPCHAGCPSAMLILYISFYLILCQCNNVDLVWGIYDIQAASATWEKSGNCVASCSHGLKDRPGNVLSSLQQCLPVWVVPCNITQSNHASCLLNFLCCWGPRLPSCQTTIYYALDLFHAVYQFNLEYINITVLIIIINHYHYYHVYQSISTYWLVVLCGEIGEHLRFHPSDRAHWLSYPWTLTQQHLAT